MKKEVSVSFIRGNKIGMVLIKAECEDSDDFAELMQFVSEAQTSLPPQGDED